MCDPFGAKSDKSQSLISSGAHLSRARVSGAGKKGEAQSILSIEYSRDRGSLLGLLLRRDLEVNSLLIAPSISLPGRSLLSHKCCITALVKSSSSVRREWLDGSKASLFVYA